MIREIFIEFPLFNKTENECETPLDYWLYNLKHMEKLESLEFKGQKALFQRLEELARIVNMNKKERDEYEACLKVYRDNYNTWNYMKEQALKEGKEEGLEIGKAEGLEIGRAEGLAKGRIEGRTEGRTEGRNIERLSHARKMLDKGYPIEDIVEITGLTIDEIKGL